MGNVSRIIRTFILLTTLLAVRNLYCQESTKVFPGADEKTPSRSEYFSWINNTNEGATEEQTMINLDFFKWLQDEYGMVLDIYAFDAGAIDGKRFYGNIYSDRFKEQFPRGFDPVYKKAKSINTRLGVWGGPDGFGDTEQEKQARIEQMVKLCRDYEFALFKFDSVCGPLRPDKEDAFIEMMIKCRQYSPDLILLNHRLGLKRGEPYATTFLWQGRETYIDVFTTNSTTAPHHRAGALERDLVPGLKRLTEDHGVCISSCLDCWDDDLILQAFSRCLILAPQVYGSPWLLRDDEFPKLARIFNLHRKYRDILVNGIVLPAEKYGPYAVSRGDERTRLITLRNLTWEPASYKIRLDAEIGIEKADKIEVRQFHPFEQIIGTFPSGREISIEVAPYRSCLLLATSAGCDEPGVVGCRYEVIRNVQNKPVEIKLLGMPGTSAEIQLLNYANYSGTNLDGKPAQQLLKGGSVNVKFPGEPLRDSYHRKLADLQETEIPKDADALYEATVFSANNNALEVHSLYRSGPTRISQAQKARDAFFNQDVFVERGVWDRNLFDGNMATAFWPKRRGSSDLRISGGCLRLDFGEVLNVDTIILKIPDEYSLQPLLNDEGNYAEISQDLNSWRTITYLAAKRSVIEVNGPVRYMRLRTSPDRISEIEAYKDGKILPREKWRASNLFAHAGSMRPQKAWRTAFTLDEIAKGSYLCIAINGEHEIEGAYAAIKVDGQMVGCPDRAPSYVSNTWEFPVSRRTRNYTYYVPLNSEMKNKAIEVFVFAYNKERTDLKPEVWISAYPVPYEEKRLVLKR